MDFSFKEVTEHIAGEITKTSDKFQMNNINGFLSQYGVYIGIGVCIVLVILILIDVIKSLFGQGRNK